jgi:hypothetical protein
MPNVAELLSGRSLFLLFGALLAAHNPCLAAGAAIEITHRKQKTEKFLIGIRTHLGESRFCAKMSEETSELR